MEKPITTDSFELQESAMRPTEQYKKWLRILECELPRYFSRGLKAVPCVGCGSKEVKPVFTKFKFSYVQCTNCHSVFASPRPSEASLTRFYKNSKAIQFWKKNIAPQTADTRRAHQVQPLQTWAKSIVKHRAEQFTHALDYEQKFVSIWDDEFIAHLPRLKRVSVTGPANAVGTKKSQQVSLKDIRPKSVDIITALDVLDRARDPQTTVEILASLLRPKGILLLTTNTGSGFEYLVLGGHSPRLMPPDRLNLLTVEAITDTLTKNGFELLDVATPGKLDMQVVQTALSENPAIQVGPFLEHLFKFRSATALESFQNFLQLNSMSSYLRIAAVKK